MRVYLDVCCLNRPFDDQTQDRIRLEAEAVILILRHLESKDWQWIGSEAVDLEIIQTPDKERQNRVQLLTKHVHESVRIESGELTRAQELEKLGFHVIDALHLACAESGSADVLLTTDDRLLRLAARVSNDLNIHVANPLAWLAKVSEK
jgi:predicted nucleic acid-binding protein